MTEKRKSFKTLAEDLRALRRRPIPQEEVGRFNKIMEEEEKKNSQTSEHEKNDPHQKDRKSARPPEADV